MASPSKTSVPLGRDPLVLVGIAVAAIIPAVVFGVATADWIEWFTHPMRAERLGRTPDDTIQGVRVLRIAAVLAAIGWLAVPLALRRLRLVPHGPRAFRGRQPADAQDGDVGVQGRAGLDVGRGVPRVRARVADGGVVSSCRACGHEWGNLCLCIMCRVDSVYVRFGLRRADSVRQASFAGFHGGQSPALQAIRSIER